MQYKAELKGLTPLLQNRYTEHAEVEGVKATRNVLVQEVVPRDEAARKVYRLPDGSLAHPGSAIARLMREAGGAHKMKGSRKSAKYIVPAAVIVLTDMMVLRDATGPAANFEVDSRSVVIPATKGRIMRHRPRFDQWSTEVVVEVDEELLPPDVVHQLLVEGGKRLGLGDFRPEKGGPFGRFSVVGWRPITEAA